MEERIDEGKIKEAQPSKLLKETDKNYLKNCICRISSNKIGTGFFSKIKYKEKLTPVLITNYHVIDDNYIEKEKYIKFYVDDNCKIINIDNNSRIYSSVKNKFDIMIIWHVS